MFACVCVGKPPETDQLLFWELGEPKMAAEKIGRRENLERTQETGFTSPCAHTYAHAHLFPIVVRTDSFTNLKLNEAVVS